MQAPSPRLMVRLLVLPLFLVAACGEDDPTGPGPGQEAPPTVATFDLIQEEIFDGTCVACHMNGNPYAEQSGLVLESGAAFDNLIGLEPTDASAREDGFLLVDPGDADRSLLHYKLRWDHSPEQPGYGAPMPMGMDPLPVGQVEFVREWIEAGAPREDSVASPALLEDGTEQDVTAFVPLPPPAQGYQVHFGPFEVEPQSERELFVSQPLGNEEAIWINRSEVSMRPNSHHFILYFFPPDAPAHAVPTHGEVRDLWDPWPHFNPSAMQGMSHRRRVASAQTEDAELQFPEGVALRLPPGGTVDVNSHYLNWGEEVIHGEVYVNLHTMEEGEVEHEADDLFLINASLDIPPHEPGETTVESQNYFFQDSRKIFMLSSHMHGKGERFEIFRLNADGSIGESLYDTDDWAHPDVEYFDPPLELGPGEGLRSEVTFHNPTDETVGWGFSSEDEMSIIVGYYY